MAGISTREIKQRIHSMESTRQITKAMEMVAASKLRRAQAQEAAARPYFEIIYGVIQDIAHANRDLTLPYFTAPGQGGGKSAWLVIAGDRGLAGGYNGNVFRFCERQMNGRDAAVLPMGRRAVEYFRARKVPLLGERYAEAEGIAVGDCFSMAKALCAGFLEGEYEEVHLVYTRFVSVLSQKPMTMRLLPLERRDEAKGSAAPDILYEPDSAEVFKTIIPEYIGGVIYGALCESRASEQAARRMAMNTATQNADDMIADLSLKYNQARQAAITQEITEIVAGV